MLPARNNAENYEPPLAFEYIASFASSAAAIFASHSGDPFIQSVVSAATSISQLLLVNNSPYFQRKLRKLLIGIEHGITESDRVRKFDFSSLSNDDKDRLTSLCIRIMEIATKSRDQKIDQLCNALLNAAISYDLDEDLQFMFVRYIDEFTPSHMEMLAFLNDNEFAPGAISPLREELNPKIYQAIKVVHSKFEDINFFKVILGDLRNKAFISVMASKTPEKPYHQCVTDLGKQFQDFITLPK